MTYRLTITVLLTLVCATLAVPAVAQSQNSVDDFRDIGSKIITESKIFPLVRSTIDGPSSPEPTIALLASNDGTIGKARFGYLLKDIVSLDLTASAPISAGGATFSTNKGISGGATIEAGLQLVLYRKQRPVALRSEFARRSQNAMVAAEVPALITSQQMTETFDFDQLVAAAMVAAAPRANAPPDAPLTVQQRQSQAAELDGERGREAFASAFRLLANDMEGWQVDRSVLLSIGGTKSRPVFTVADGASFRSVTKNASTADISLGLIESASTDTLSRGYYFGLNFSSGTVFNATARQTCLPVGTNGGSQCRNAVMTEPGPADTESYEGDIRYYFSGLKFAVGFRPAYDRKAAEHEKWSITVPLMFLQNSKDLQSSLQGDKAGLTGGLSVGVKDSPEGRSFFAVFSIGSIFQIPGLPH